MSTEEKEIKPENGSPSESESISCLQTEEAIAKLEDHRCAICQNIIINVRNIHKYIIRIIFIFIFHKLLFPYMS